MASSRAACPVGRAVHRRAVCDADPTACRAVFPRESLNSALVYDFEVGGAVCGGMKIRRTDSFEVIGEMLVGRGISSAPGSPQIWIVVSMAS